MADIYTPTWGWPRRTPLSALWLNSLVAMAGWACTIGVGWMTSTLGGRARSLDQFESLAPGMDVWLILAVHLRQTWQFAPYDAMFAASLAALPFAIVLILRTTPDKSQPTATMFKVLGHPVTAALFLSGYGWAVVGFYGLFRLLVDIPRRMPHLGMPLGGVALGLGFLCIPDFMRFGLPVAAILWLLAPRLMLSRHMRVFYILSFAPLGMLWLSYLYTDWLFGDGPAVPFVHPQMALPFWVLIFCLALSAPALLAGAASHSWRVAIAFLGSLAIAAATGADHLLILGGGTIAAATLLPHLRAPLTAQLSGVVGGGIVLTVLDLFLRVG